MKGRIIPELINQQRFVAHCPNVCHSPTEAHLGPCIVFQCEGICWKLLWELRDDTLLACNGSAPGDPHPLGRADMDLLDIAELLVDLILEEV